ncbi:hypothetical protein OUZ56_011910 [Daphnia magna]|uniref:Uncharacterized protein n=1 Tax=Daphnia magna TaxID=35525 RepID=A0ABQ9Z1I1_9CRUS|nr:hypothetical protein OUZ56_011910 [Daphnia magna]
MHIVGPVQESAKMQTLLFLLCLLHSPNPTYPIYASVCDCNNMKIRGILDFKSPYYCDNEKPETQHLPRIPTAYTLIGSFDTVYSQETILVTPLECWRMVNDKNCGDNNMQIGQTGLSFTATPTGEGIDQSLKLEQCAAEENMKKNQQWIFQIINTNPDIVENFAVAKLEDIQEVRLEQQKAVTSTINSPVFGGILKTNHGTGNIIWDMIAWGLLKNGQYPNEKGVTHHGLNEQLTVENCDTDWTKCQEELKTFITRNDPLVQSQVSVGNCRGYCCRSN